MGSWRCCPACLTAVPRRAGAGDRGRPAEVGRVAAADAGHRPAPSRPAAARRRAPRPGTRWGAARDAAAALAGTDGLRGQGCRWEAGPFRLGRTRTGGPARFPAAHVVSSSLARSLVCRSWGEDAAAWAETWRAAGAGEPWAAGRGERHDRPDAAGHHRRPRHLRGPNSTFFFSPRHAQPPHACTSLSPPLGVGADRRYYTEFQVPIHVECMNPLMDLHGFWAVLEPVRGSQPAAATQQYDSAPRLQRTWTL
jgi:hypothetical protein